MINPNSETNPSNTRLIDRQSHGQSEEGQNRFDGAPDGRIIYVVAFGLYDGL
jgi:hypothetical protein